MNYKWHTRISLAAVFIVALLLEFSGNYPVEEIAAFVLVGYFNTVFASPDIDHRKSRPTQNMKGVGWITSRLFTHRGLLHNPIFWTILYIGIGVFVQYKYSYEVWWISGGLIAIYTHIILDCISTKTKRVKTKVRHKLHL